LLDDDSQFENVGILRTLAAKPGIMATLSQLPWPRIKQRAEKDSRQISGMARAGGMS
jgi:hypothetical protein